MDISDFSAGQLRLYTEGKVILSYYGCFCPPHAGHYNLLTYVIEKTRPNIVVITTTNREEDSRHGVPLSFTLKTWKNWAKILQQKYGVDTYVSSFTVDGITYNGSSPNIKEYIEINVHEGDEMDIKYINNPKQLEDLSRMSLAFLHGVQRKSKRYYTYHVQRKGHLSATQFVKCLSNLENECLEYVPNDVNNKQAYIDEIRNNYYSRLH